MGQECLPVNKEIVEGIAEQRKEHFDSEELCTHTSSVCTTKERSCCSTRVQGYLVGRGSRHFRDKRNIAKERCYETDIWRVKRRKGGRSEGIRERSGKIKEHKLLCAYPVYISRF